MNGLAVGLVLASAVIHASWNLLVKRADGGATFVWLYTAVASVIYAPLVLGILLTQQMNLSVPGAIAVVASVFLHLLYQLTLQYGYRHGDLSVVYPLARGIGPTVSTLAAILFLGEEPGAVSLSGAGLVILGVIVLTSTGRTEPTKNGRVAIFYGVLCGLSIAAYTVCDKVAVSNLQVSPFLLPVVLYFGVAALLSPHALRKKDEVKRLWKTYWREILGIAILSPASYILVLKAMSFTMLSYVASAREISILFGVLLGTRLLGEGDWLRRTIAAGVMVTGLIVLVIGSAGS